MYDRQMPARVAVCILAAGILLLSCSKENNHNSPPPTGGFQYTSEDSIYTIPSTAVTFAQHNFSRDAELLREYQVALTQNWQLPLNSWKQSGFDTRRQYLVPPFENDVTTSDSALFYYEIGAFFGQFGFGWRDTFDTTGFNPDSAYTANIWPTDRTETVGFDGASAFFTQYRSMWTTEPI